MAVSESRPMQLARSTDARTHEGRVPHLVPSPRGVGQTHGEDSGLLFGGGGTLPCAAAKLLLGFE